MKRVFLALSVLGLAAATPALGADVEALKAEAKAVMMKFGGALKGELETAMKAGGPKQAIPVCNEKAPAIAHDVSAAEGWTVGRSSHKLRNPHNEPDAFTRGAIEDFLARQEKGETADTLVKAGVVEEGGKKVFRIVKAIPTGEVCLNCHGGEEVKAETAELLAKYYPDDKARGFKVGEMRGVFTLSKELAD
ncbi:MAG: DUF3365 domain-containing protein [Hyphomicrobiales bacterium]